MIFVLHITISMLLAVILETYAIAKEDLGRKLASAETSFAKQIQHLWLQSRILSFIRMKQGKEAWHRLEYIRKTLASLEAENHALLRATVGREKAKFSLFVITRRTLKEMGLPEEQAAFLWKVFPSCFQ